MTYVKPATDASGKYKYHEFKENDPSEGGQHRMWAFLDVPLMKPTAATPVEIWTSPKTDATPNEFVGKDDGTR